jgi:hypothetical protein
MDGSVPPKISYSIPVSRMVGCSDCDWLVRRSRTDNLSFSISSEGNTPQLPTTNSRAKKLF